MLSERKRSSSGTAVGSDRQVRGRGEAVRECLRRNRFPILPSSPEASLCGCLGPNHFDSHRLIERDCLAARSTNQPETQTCRVFATGSGSDGMFRSGGGFRAGESSADGLSEGGAESGARMDSLGLEFSPTRRDRRKIDRTAPSARMVTAALRVVPLKATPWRDYGTSVTLVLKTIFIFA